MKTDPLINGYTEINNLHIQPTYSSIIMYTVPKDFPEILNFSTWEVFVNDSTVLKNKSIAPMGSDGLFLT
jgi:hypothetical protein